VGKSQVGRRIGRWIQWGGVGEKVWAVGICCVLGIVSTFTWARNLIV